MAKKEKRINLRLTGMDLCNYELCGVGSTDIFRSGLYDENRKNKSKQEILLKSQILRVQNEILEDEMRIRANKLLLDELLNDLKNVKGFTESKRNKFINRMKNEYYDFINDERYSNCDLNDFYRIRKDAISIYAMKVGIDYEFAIDVFESYLEDEVAKQNVLMNTKSSEKE